MADSCILKALAELVIFLILPNPFPFSVIAIIGLISIAGAIGNFLVNESVVHGKAGPTSALCEVQSLWLLALEIMFNPNKERKGPSPSQLVGFALGTIGGSFIAFAPSENNSAH